MKRESKDFDFDKALLEFGLPSEMVNNINRGPQHTCGLEYRIIPLDSPAIRKQDNDREFEYDAPTELFLIGKEVAGYSVKQNKMICGRIVNFVWDEEEPDTVKYYTIQDEESNITTNIFANSAHFIDNMKRSKDSADYIFQNQIKDIKSDFFNSDEKHFEKESRFRKAFNENIEVETSDVLNHFNINDDAYKKAFLIDFHIKPKYINYFDDKFSGKYTNTNIYITELDKSLFCSMMGISETDDENMIELSKKFIQSFLKSVSQKDSRVNVMFTGRKIRFQYYERKYPVINSWYHLWLYAQAFNKCRLYEKYLINEYNNDIKIVKNNKIFNEIVSNLICHDLIKRPEYIKLPNGNIKETYI